MSTADSIYASQRRRDPGLHDGRRQLGEPSAQTPAPFAAQSDPYPSLPRSGQLLAQRRNPNNCSIKMTYYTSLSYTVRRRSSRAALAGAHH